MKWRRGWFDDHYDMPLQIIRFARLQKTYNGFVPEIEVDWDCIFSTGVGLRIVIEWRIFFRLKYLGSSAGGPGSITALFEQTWRVSCLWSVVSQGGTTCGSLAVGLQENGENEKMKRKCRENEEMERDSLFTFPHSLFISSLSIHFLYQNLSHFVAKYQLQHFCHEWHKKHNICAMRK